MSALAFWLLLSSALQLLRNVKPLTTQVILSHAMSSSPYGTSPWYSTTRTARMTSGEPLTTAERADADLDKQKIVSGLHRIGILYSLSDDYATTILDQIANDKITFEIVNVTTVASNQFDSYSEAWQEMREKDVAVLIGPFHHEYSVVCEHLRVPYMVTSQMPGDSPDVDDNAFLIELFPNARIFARSILDVIQYQGFEKKVGMVYDSKAGATILEAMLGQPQLEVLAFRIDPRNASEVRTALRTMRDQFYHNFVAVLSADVTSHVMEQGLSLSLFSSPNTWVLVNTGLDEFDLERYVDSRANLTVLRLMMDYKSRYCSLNPNSINLKRAIFHDAVRVYVTHVAERANRTYFSMREANRKMELDGCTGHLEFTRFGRRKESFLQLMTLQGYRTGMVTDEDFLSVVDLGRKSRRYQENLQKEEEGDIRSWYQRLGGTWRSAPAELQLRVVPSRSYSSVTRLGRNVFGDYPLRVTTKIEKPFVQYVKDPKQWQSSDDVVLIQTGPNSTQQLEGMLIDILKELARVCEFTFKISFVPDDKFGSYKGPATGWTGMVRQLLDNKVDVALAPFQMSASRSEVVDFTKPFMTKGTTVVIRRPEQHLWIFQFLSPLSKVVWCAIFLSFIVVSLSLFGVSRVNSDRQAKFTSNFRESFWYIWGTLLRGSLNGAPRAISSRIVSSAWWFFCLIVTSIYTANLAAFLTITIGDAGINAASDLANQDNYAYGTVNDSQTQTFFSHTLMPEYSKMWAQMSTLAPQSMVNRVEQGFERVMKGRYAFIWDTPTIRYEISENCDLMEIGDPFDLKGYGLGLQKYAPFGEKLSWALLKLNDDGVLYRLERKWFRPQFCPSHRQSATTESLNIQTVLGMYLVLGGGIILSVSLCLVQFFVQKCRVRKKQKRKKRAEQDAAETAAQLEPCLKSGTVYTDVSASSDPETIQVYANHSPYGGFKSINAEW